MAFAFEEASSFHLGNINFTPSFSWRISFIYGRTRRHRECAKTTVCRCRLNLILRWRFRRENGTRHKALSRPISRKKQVIDTRGEYRHVLLFSEALSEGRSNPWSGSSTAYKD